MNIHFSEVIIQLYLNVQLYTNNKKTCSSCDKKTNTTDDATNTTDDGTAANWPPRNQSAACQIDAAVDVNSAMV